MKIKLISAAVRSKSKWSQIMTLSLPAVAAATPEGYEVAIEDERVKPIRLDDHPDLVGISFEVFRANRAYEIADHYRQRHVPVVLGGMHASVMPEEGLQHADKQILHAVPCASRGKRGPALPGGEGGLSWRFCRGRVNVGGGSIGSE